MGDGGKGRAKQLHPEKQSTKKSDLKEQIKRRPGRAGFPQQETWKN